MYIEKKITKKTHGTIQNGKNEHISFRISSIKQQFYTCYHHKCHIHTQTLTRQSM